MIKDLKSFDRAEFVKDKTNLLLRDKGLTPHLFFSDNLTLLRFLAHAVDQSKSFINQKVLWRRAL